MSLPNAAAVRALTERLVAIASVSPDVAGETRCAQALTEALPAGIERGTWPTGDGRPVVWALVRGRSPRTLLVLGHYDTVGFDEYAAFDAPAGSAIALDPTALRERLVSEGAARAHGALLARDIEEEWRRPGSWMFGRGALDMKSGLAAGIAALGSLAASADSLGGSVMFVATPDEENHSEGMRTALGRLLDFQIERQADFLGVLNLDYSDAPAAHRGALGKSRIGLWVLGTSAHAGRPFEAVDATQIAAHLVLTATLSPALIERCNELAGPPPVALRMRDLKPRYDVQTAVEAAIELNVLTFARKPAEILERVRAMATTAAADVLRRRDALRGEISLAEGVRAASPAPVVKTLEELESGTPLNVDEVLNSLTSMPWRGSDAAHATLDRLRTLATRARLTGPSIVIYELPPHYPAVGPCEGPLSRAAAEVLGREGVEIRPYYPFVTDASLLADPMAPQFNVTGGVPLARAARRPAGSEPDIVTLE
ncbi:MAG: M20/M25/M40 family metallo-hydrolase, partial [Candidatus Eiseniibacteriota bacterium]